MQSAHLKPEKKKYQMNTIAFNPNVVEIAITLNFMPTSFEVVFVSRVDTSLLCKFYNVTIYYKSLH